MVDIPDLAGAIDEITRRHGFDVKTCRARLISVISNFEVGGVPGQETLCSASLFVEVDGQNRQTLVGEVGLQLILEGEGLPTGAAPGGP